MNLTLGDILRRNAQWANNGRKTALIFEDRAWSYVALNDFVNRIANGLLDLGVGRGDRVAVLGRNSDTYVALYFALAKLGVVMVPVSFWYRTEEIRYTLEQSSSRWLIAESRYRDIARSAIDATAHAVRMIQYDGSEAKAQLHPTESTANDYRNDIPPTLATLTAHASLEEPPVQVHPEDHHIILYTSGTTGFPKGATFSHQAHFNHAIAWALRTGQTSDDVGIVVYPLFHTGGPDCVVLPHFLVGGTIVVQDGADPARILAAAERYRLTNIFAVPTVWRWILAEFENTTYDVSSVRRCLGSSDTLPPDLLSGILDRFNADVWVTYGLTEAGCILTYSRLTRDNHRKIHTVGKPHPLVELRIVDQAGHDVPPGEVGEIIARGPTMMDGYWNMPERTEETLVDGWLHSGDLGRYDEDGYISIAGRLKDMIVSGGEKIYPIEVEKLLRQHPGIRDAALVGVPDGEWGQAVLAVIVREANADLAAADVIDHVRTHLAGYKRPKYVEFVDALPVTTSTGKVQKGILRERFGPKYAR